MMSMRRPGTPPAVAAAAAGLGTVAGGEAAAGGGGASGGSPGIKFEGPGGEKKGLAWMQANLAPDMLQQHLEQLEVRSPGALPE
jgi:hypothetical protein